VITVRKNKKERIMKGKEKMSTGVKGMEVSQKDECLMHNTP
jgi:hypothetical protein